MKSSIEMERTYYGGYVYRMFMLFCGIMMTFMFSCCISEIVEQEPATIELHLGYRMQFTASSKNVEWVSDNPSVATVSATGLVTAISKGTATIYTYSSKGKQNIVCYLITYPKRNILFYIGGDNDLLSETYQKINQVRAGWNPCKGEMIIYADQRNKGACLLRVNETKDAAGYYGLDTIAKYGAENSADAGTLNRVINKIVQDYPADSYGMIFFSHASGWLPKGTLNSPRSLVIDDGDGVKYEMEYDDFASAIPDKQFDFILFEACLMADVMSMYELRNKAEYVLASSAEIVSPGFEPVYKNEIMRLYDTKNDIKSVVSGFGQSYYDHIISSYPEISDVCSATLSLIKTDEMEALAAVTKSVLNGTEMDEKNVTPLSDIQWFDRPGKLGRNPYCRYFDFAHTIEKLMPEADRRAFNEQIEKTVVWKVATKRFLLNGSNESPNFVEYDGFFIERHSGLTTYISQDVYPVLNSAFKGSSWYKAID